MTKLISLIATAVLLFSFMVPANAAPDSYTSEHYQALMKAWATGTVDERVQYEEVYWSMQAVDILSIQEMLPIELSPYTSTFEISQEGKTQTYKYAVKGKPFSKGSEEEQSLFARVTNDICGDIFTSFQVLAMGGTIRFEWHFPGHNDFVNSLSINSASCGSGI